MAIAMMEPATTKVRPTVSKPSILPRMYMAGALAEPVTPAALTAVTST